LPEEIHWSQEALAEFEKVPEFVREVAREMIEQFARDQGASQITPEIMKKARAKMGM